MGAGCKVGCDPADADPDKWGLAVVAPGCVLEAGRVVAPKTMLNKNGEEVSR